MTIQKTKLTPDSKPVRSPFTLKISILRLSNDREDFRAAASILFLVNGAKKMKIFTGANPWELITAAFSWLHSEDATFNTERTLKNARQCNG